MTPEQFATLKADILADPVLAALPLTSAAALQIADAYNALSSKDVWRTDAPVSAIYDAVDWTKFTPVAAMDDASLSDALVAKRTAQLLAIQTKQINLQNMLTGRATIDASKTNIRAGLRDSVIALPAGAAGASVSAGGAGGATVLAALIRKATRFESVFATAQATTGPTSAYLLVLEGQVSIDDIQQARES